ncbi:MAG: DUF1501 domain-containing protein, partial [Anaerolineales bacterium]
MENRKFNRRDFLSLSGMGYLAGVSRSLFPDLMPRFALRPPGQSAPGDVLLCIFLRGGMDGISAVVPYGDGADYYDSRPTQAVPESMAQNLDGFFGLHPALSPLKEIYDEKQLVFIHAAGSTDSSRSHFDAMKFMEYGTPGDKTTGTGWINRQLQTAARDNQSPFRAVGMGAMLQDSLRGPITPLS